MRNGVLKLVAAGLIVIACGVASWWLLAPPAPQPPVENVAQREQARRAQEIIDNVQQGHVGNARALADRFYREFPDSREIQNLERLTGYHPRPYGP